jgi:hypothetical protein
MLTATQLAANKFVILITGQGLKRKLTLPGELSYPPFLSRILLSAAESDMSVLIAVDDMKYAGVIGLSLIAWLSLKT